MMWIDRVRMLHIAAGFVALMVFWLPMISRKGGLFHRRVGWIYVGAMAVEAVTAVVVCGARILFDSPQVRSRAIFLMFISVLAASSASQGVRALRQKNRNAPARKPINMGLPTLFFVSSVALEIYGLGIRTPLYIVFGLIGMVTSGGQLYYWLRAPRSRMDWWFEHMTGMGVSSIATLTAFVVVNAPRLGLPIFSVIPWVAPGVIGTIGLVVWTRYYRRKFAPSEKRIRPARSEDAIAGAR